MPISAELPPAMIQDLTIVTDGYENEEAALLAHLWIIKQCPNLVQLRWSTKGFDLERGPMHLLTEAIRSENHQWPLLKSLTLRQPFLNEDLATLIEGMPELMDLDLSGSNFNIDSWLTLQKTPQLLQAIRILDLEYCRDMPGSVIHDMMCSSAMPSLEVFRAGSVVTDTDILKDTRPWLCTGLRKLTAIFALETSRSSQSMILSRLSALRKLEDLRFCGDKGLPPIVPSGQEIRLKVQDEDEEENGGEGGSLDQLRPLGLLTKFIVPADDSIVWGRQEAQWVLKNWPRLKRLVGAWNVIFRYRLASQPLRPVHFKTEQHSRTDVEWVKSPYPRATALDGRVLGYVVPGRCLRVSKSWYDIFLSLFWRTVEILPTTKESSTRNPTTKLVRCHASFIRKLFIDIDFPEVFLKGLSYPNLRQLTILENDSPECSLSEEFIHEHRATLRTLRLDYPISDKLLTLLVKQCPRLRSLEPYDHRSKPEMQTYVLLLRRLQQLNLQGPLLREHSDVRGLEESLSEMTTQEQVTELRLATVESGVTITSSQFICP
ncbi:hypothetical protein BGZ83_006823 [Gryganskiella cystojenkinii]|nr:hypothetical protein BGZ83_006823 [Gryganskiella cystojenkinii]